MSPVLGSGAGAQFGMGAASGPPAHMPEPVPVDVVVLPVDVLVLPVDVLLVLVDDEPPTPAPPWLPPPEPPLGSLSSEHAAIAKGTMSIRHQAEAGDRSMAPA